MEEFHYSTAFFIGKQGKRKWVGVHGLVPSMTSERVEESGYLFFIIQLESFVDFDLDRVGELLKDEFVEEYYSEKGNIEGLLTGSIEATRDRLTQILQREKAVSEKGIKLDVGALVLFEDLAYIAVSGDVSVFLCRRNNLVDISEAIKDITGKSDIRKGSLYVKGRDVFALVSPDGLFNVEEEVLKKSIDKWDLNDLEKMEDEKKVGVGLLLAKVEDDEDDIGEVNVEDNKEKDVESGYEEKDQSVGTFQDEKKYKEKDQKTEDSDKEELRGKEDEEEESEEKEKPPEPKRLQNLDNSFIGKIKSLKENEKVQKGVSKFIEVLKKGFNFIKEKVLGFKEGGFYLRGAGDKRSTRGIIIIIIVIILILFFSFRTISNQREKSRQKDEEQTILNQVSESLLTAEELQSTQSAINYINEAKEGLEKAQQIGMLPDEEAELESRIIALEDKINRVVRVGDEIILEGLAGYFDGVSAYDFDIFGGDLYISDSARGAIYKLNYNGGEVEELLTRINGLESPESIVFDTEGNLLIYDSQVGMMKANVDEKSVEAITGLSTSSIGDVEQIEYFEVQDGPKYIYYLVPGKQTIDRSIETLSGYGFPAVRYENSEFSTSKDFGIDMGSGNRLYAITSGGKGYIRFLGDLDPFDIQGMTEELNGSTSLDTDDYRLYFGDSSNARIVVTTKGRNDNPQAGDLIVQFKYAGDQELFKDIKEIQVDNSTMDLFILDGNQILKIDLNLMNDFLLD